MKWLFFIVALVAVGFVFLARRGRSTAGTANGTRDANRRLTDTSKFHAVSLKPGSNACEEARAVEGKRYLANSAPRLPLPGCDVAACRCRFMHHSDRRGGDDRRSPYPSPIGLEKGLYETNQRKKETDRRRDPPNAF